MKKFIETFCRTPYGRGLVTGAPASPYLFNLYCEAMLNKNLRYFCRVEGITFTQFADDLAFSGKEPIWTHTRKRIREFIGVASFAVNHRKSKVLYRKQGTVTITGFGLTDDAEGNAVITFPGKKRRALQGMLRAFIRAKRGDVNEIRGHVAYFKHYANFVPFKTKSDIKMLALCAQFQNLVALPLY
jgi:hypothetical protein